LVRPNDKLLFQFQIANLTLLVTGCSDGGFGAEICKKVVASGHQLVATARNTSSLSYLPSNNPRILTLALDVTSSEAIKIAFATAIEKFGHVDVVVNNAGYSVSGDTEAIPDADARKEFDTNFWGTVDVTKEAVRVFREVNGKGVGGLVVQVTSLGGWVAFPGSAFYHGR
jgi:NADP-dependent 3-hydroxy acid dehydrogenase YdfG